MTMKTVCNLLPASAIRILVTASAVTNYPPGTRMKAIDRAIDEVKRKFPEYFRSQR